MIGLVHCYSSSILFVSFFIGPESDPWIPLIDVTLVCEDTNSKLVEVVTVANVDDEDRVGNSLLHTWKLRLGKRVKLLFNISTKRQHLD